MPVWTETLEAVRQGASGLRRKGAATAGVVAMERGAAAVTPVGGSISSAPVGGVGGAGAVGGMGKIGAFMKGPWGPFVGMLLAQLAGSMAIGKYNELAGMDVERERMEMMGAAADPQAMYYQAMLPAYEQQEEMSRAALMSTIMGGGSQLARGQEQHGGV